MSYPGGNPNMGFGQPGQMSYPGGNPNVGFGQAPYGGSPYPPAGGAPYPPAGGAPYPPAGGSPYPPAGGSPYPPAGGSPYPPAGGSPYPPAGGSPYPPAGGSPYPPAPGSSPYPPAPGASPYPPAPGGSPYPPAPGGSPYPPAPGGSPYPPTTGSSAYPPRSTSPYPPAPGSSPYPGAPGANPYQQAQASQYPQAAAGYPPSGGAAYGQQSNPYPNMGQQAPGAGYPGAGTTYAGVPGQHGVGSTPAGYQPGGSIISYTEIPTIKPQPHFDPSSDAGTLRKAMKGFGTDEAAIINVLGRRTSHERQQIMLKYQQSYGREEADQSKKEITGDLVKDLKSELSGKFEDAVIALMTPLPQYLARELHNAMQGIGTNERTLVEILCTRDNASLLMIKNAYYHEYRKKIEDDLHGDTSGDFRRLLISMCACSRDETNCDPALANSLAQQLYKAGEGKLGTDEGEFNRILSSYSYPLLRCVFEEYKKIKGKTFLDAIKSELSGDLQLGMEAVYYTIDNRAGFFARELRNSMAGMGTHDRALIRLVVSRSEIDMGNIKQEYMKLFNKPLDKDIKGDTSGDYKKVLLQIIED